MSRFRVRAKSAEKAKKKATSKRRVVSKVNYIKGSKKGSMKTYDVITKARGK